jgi:hypothetical protein
MQGISRVEPDGIENATHNTFSKLNIINHSGGLVYLNLKLKIMTTISNC